MAGGAGRGGLITVSGRFPVGAPVVLRSVFDDHVGAAFPAVVVADDEVCVAVFQPAGTSVVTRTGRRGGPHGRNMYPGGFDGGHEVRSWTGCGVLRVHRWGDPWSVWRWRDGHTWRPGCYVNLEEPWRRTTIGFDSQDWILDLVIDGAGVATWKDDVELDWCAQVGSVTAEHAARVRRSGGQALAAFRAGEVPFAVDWDRWPVDADAVTPDLAALRRATTLVV